MIKPLVASALAVTQVNPPEAPFEWFQLGVLGLVFLALMSGQLRHKREVERERERAEAAEARAKHLEEQRDKLYEK